MLLLQVLTGAPGVVLCGDTAALRRLCRTQVSAADVVVDIGASTGAASGVCAAHGAAVTGVDISKEALEQAQLQQPNVRSALLLLAVHRIGRLASGRIFASIGYRPAQTRATVTTDLL